MPNRPSVPIVSGFKEHLQEISRNPGLPYGPYGGHPSVLSLTQFLVAFATSQSQWSASLDRQQLFQA
jgi:hypothetical protein